MRYILIKYWLHGDKYGDKEFGFDNENGRAANGKATLKLADFATMNANVTRQTTGFGGLDSRLGQRSFSDDLGYSVSSTVNLHKLVPDRFGWSFPVTVSARKNSSTPRFLPDRGDIRLDDFISAEESRTDISESEINQNVREKISEVQTVREGYSLNLSNISKSNSKSKLAQYTIDNLKLTYVYNEGFSKNPQLELQNNWNYASALSYNLSFPRVRLFRPFKFTEDISFNFGGSYLHGSAYNHDFPVKHFEPGVANNPAVTAYGMFNYKERIIVKSS